MSKTAPERAQLEAAARATRPKRPRKRPAPASTPPPSGDRDALASLLASLATMDRRNGLTGDHNVVGAYRLGSHEDAPYGLQLTDGTEINLGNAHRVLNEPRRVKAAIAGSIGVSIALPKESERWDEFFEHLHAAATVRDATLSQREETCEWIVSFLRGRTHTGRIDTGDPASLVLVIGADAPWRSVANRLHLRLAPLVRHITIDVGQRTTQRDLAERLGQLGFRRCQLSVRVDHEDPTKTYVAKSRLWASPPGFDPDDEGQTDADPTSPPLSLSDQSKNSAGTWGRGDNGATAEVPRDERRGHTGTDHAGDARPLTTSTMSDKGELQ